MTAVVERRVTELVERCYRGLEPSDLLVEALRRFRTIVPVDAAFLATVDPTTLLFTSAISEDPLASAAAQFLDNEFGRDDVNKFAALATSSAPVRSLDEATGGDRTASARYLEIMAPLGLGDELRVALMAGGRCWGVLCLHREDSELGFTDAEAALLLRVGAHLGEGLRRAVAAQREVPGGSVPGPGVVVLDENLSVVSMNQDAQQWMTELESLDRVPGAELPIALYAAAAQLTRLETEPAAPVPLSVVLRTSAGSWVSIHASRMEGAAGDHIAVVLDNASPARLSSLFLDAQGLTPAQTRVAALVLQGRSTQQIVNELRISAYTVQEHLSAVFEKFGVGSRRELVAALLGRY